MSTAGEAASLFGAADSAADPFAAVLGGDQADVTTTPSHGTASEIFDSAPDSADLFSAQGYSEDAAPEIDNSSWLGTQQYELQGAAGAASYGSETAVYANQSQSNGWYDTFNNAATSQQPSYDSNTAYNAPLTTSQDHHNYTYDTYAPSSNTLETSYPNTAAPPVPDAMRAYEPRAPTTTVSYAPASSTTVTQDSYDPYRPSTISMHKEAAASMHSHAYVGTTPAVQAQHSSGLVIPPATVVAATPSAPPFRPKTSNAYDPPLLPPKPKRSIAPTWQAHPPTSQYMRSPPMVASPPLPAPPRSGRSPIPPPSLRQGALPPLPPTGVQPASPPAVLQTEAYVSNYAASVINEPSVVTGSDYTYRSEGLARASGVANDVHWSQLVNSPGDVPAAAYVRHDVQSTTTELERPVTEGAADFPGESFDPEAAVFGEEPFAPRHDDTMHIATARLKAGIEEVKARFDTPIVSPPPPRRNSTHSQTAYQPHSQADSRRGSQSSIGPPQPRVRPPDSSISAARARSPLSSSSVYEPFVGNRSPERANSPHEASEYGTDDSYTRPSDVYNGQYASSVTLSPPLASKDLQLRYAPDSANPASQSYADFQRATSPATSIHSILSPSTKTQDPYTSSLSDRIVSSSDLRARSQSNGSTYSAPAMRDDPYAPSRHVRKQPSESSSHGGSVSSYQYDTIPEGVVHESRPMASHDLATAQVLSIPTQNRSAYAPSPSLLGTNDPLGRTSARVPVISFGFGGKLVTCFHGADLLHTGFDVALSARQSTDVKLYALHKVVPRSALDTTAASYPGPLFSDPGTSSTSLIGTGMTSQIKTKKGLVAKYLEERSEELSRAISYLPQDSLETKRSEAKHTLVRLLKVMVENDGRLAGSSQVDAAVRAALVPRLGGAEAAKDGSPLAPGGPYIGETSSLTATPSMLRATLLSSPSNSAPLAVHSLRSSNLDTIQDFLLRGDRRGACHYASDEKLWAHALVIASSIDKDTWKDVVTEFVRSELADRDAGTAPLTSISESAGKAKASGGREALRVAYSLFAGQGAASVQELLPPKPLLQNSQTLQLPPSLSSSLASVTPVSPNFPSPAPAMEIPADVLAKWADTAAMMISNPMTAESVAALTALGDQLAANQWSEAAHACYLLCQASPGVGSPIARLGGLNSRIASNFFQHQDTIIFNEILEFAMSLVVPTKGQDAFTGLPYLQPFRFMRAAVLAELGHVQLAHRYCEAIANCVGRNPAYYNPMFVEQLKGLTDRLVAAPQLDKSISWIGSKMAKPSLDSIGNWLEGRLTKFIAGENDAVHHDDTATAVQQQPLAGPFANYSTISSTTSSTMPSPRHSQADLDGLPNSSPFRTGSAMAVRSMVPPPNALVNRAASAMDHVRPFERKPSPIPRVSSASATTTTFTNGSLYTQALNGYAFGSAAKHNPADVKQDEASSSDDAQSHEQLNSPSTGLWWGSSEAGSGAPTPTASTFVHLDEEPAVEGPPNGFFSLMDDPAFSITPTALKPADSVANGGSRSDFEDEEDDLGLGNSSKRAKARESTEREDSTPAQVEEVKPAQPQKPELKTASSGSWLSRIWKRSETPGPVRANLGQETTFYFDSELKRWVNKNAPAEAAKSGPPPPPARAQTASPGRSQGQLPTDISAGPPPARPATANAIDSSSGPPQRPAMRVRSNLVPTDSRDPSIPPTPMSAPPMGSTPPPADGPPPAGRAKAQAKRPIRNRYVDVFQQQQAA
ncbi:hypothetical protein OBBRIDRAFT_788730 [Obba rivulosa]|uniref:Protein transport protein sec16 n=1 Tax=Obba rivulosa TaxID=1052685 RepID=A0A8E2DSS3_9APHY|nr:hypothetical protein OBBRIDRAFT_788730 [Obba rivulosa]